MRYICQYCGPFQHLVDHLRALATRYTDCYVVIGDEDVEPMAGTYHHEHGTVPVDSHRLFVCFTHSFGKEPICDFAIMEGSTDEASPPAGFEVGFA